MEEEHGKQDNTSRRKFVEKLLLGSSAVVAGAAMVAGADYQEKKKPGSLLTLRDGSPAVYHHHEEEATAEGGETLEALQKRGREGIAGKRFVMVIDLSRCRNARKCMESCNNAHDLKPEQHHMNVLQMKETANTPMYYMPKPCQHCDNPPCTAVCPVNATFKRQDGIVLIDNERCIGCRFCMAACPYSARVFHWSEPANKPEDMDKPYNIELNVPQKLGTISKCLFSADRLRENKLPYCVSACPNGTYYFGDENEDAVTNGTTKETVKLSKLLEDNGAYTLMPELGTKPRVYYLPAKNRLFPVPEEDKENFEKMNEEHA